MALSFGISGDGAFAFLRREGTQMGRTLQTATLLVLASACLLDQCARAQEYIVGEFSGYITSVSGTIAGTQFGINMLPAYVPCVGEQFTGTFGYWTSPNCYFEITTSPSEGVVFSIGGFQSNNVYQDGYEATFDNQAGGGLPMGMSPFCISSWGTAMDLVELTNPANPFPTDGAITSALTAADFGTMVFLAQGSGGDDPLTYEGTIDWLYMTIAPEPSSLAIFGLAGAMIMS